MKIKVFSHNDLDGVGASFVYKMLYGKKNVSVHNLSIPDVDKTIAKFLNNELTISNYTDHHSKESFVDELGSYDRIAITDVSVGEDVAEKLDVIHKNPKLPDVELIDHHVTAEWLNKYEWASVLPEFDNNKSSATSLALHFILERNDMDDAKRIDGLIEPMKKFSETVRQYDTWDWFNVTNNQTAKELNDYLYMVGAKKFESDMEQNILNSNEDNEFNFFNKTARILLDMNKESIDKYIQSKEKTMIVKDGVGHIFADEHTSELGNTVCTNNPEIDYVMIYNLSRLSVSLRTVKDEFDVSSIAKSMGGGGHPKASGAPIDSSVVNTIIDRVTE